MKLGFQPRLRSVESLRVIGQAAPRCVAASLESLTIGVSGQFKAEASDVLRAVERGALPLETLGMGATRIHHTRGHYYIDAPTCSTTLSPYEPAWPATIHVGRAALGSDVQAHAHTVAEAIAIAHRAVHVTGTRARCVVLAAEVEGVQPIARDELPALCMPARSRCVPIEEHGRIVEIILAPRGSLSVAIEQRTPRRMRVSARFALDALREFGLLDVFALLESLDGLWAYATHRYRLVRSCVSRRDRCPIDPRWRAIQRTPRFGGRNTPCRRRHRASRVSS